MKRGLQLRVIASLTGIVLFPVLLSSIFGIRTSVDNGSGAKTNDTFLFVVVLLFISFVFCAIWLTRVVSRKIVVPLRELNGAAEQIMDGNLDFEILYKSKDEMGRFSEAFELMRARLKELLDKQAVYEHSRKELIANISHDLRTPISSIRGYVEGLQDGIVHNKEKYDRYLSVIKTKTDVLDNLIEDLFQFSRLDSGQLLMDFQDEDSQEMPEAIVKPIEMEFKDTDANLVVRRPFPSMAMQADRKRLAQVFDNIIGNARKYAGTNCTITITAERIGGSMRIAVADNGAGIPSEDIPNLFEKFYRGEKSRSRAFGGTGLGLAICKLIVEEHQGEIGVHSQTGTGTEFYFTLPAKVHS